MLKTSALANPPMWIPAVMTPEAAVTAVAATVVVAVENQNKQARPMPLKVLRAWGGTAKLSAPGRRSQNKNIRNHIEAVSIPTRYH
jgi:hypothetical protein